jgi:hypothetical protein
VIDIEALAAEPPLLDEIEFTKLCEEALTAFRSDRSWPTDVPYPGCHTIILGPAGVYGFPVWSEGRYSDLSLREARMMARILHERLGLIYDPQSRDPGWAEVATGRFLVNSVNAEVVPCPYPR